MTSTQSLHHGLAQKNWLSVLHETDEQLFFSSWMQLLVSRFSGVSEATLVTGPANIGPFRPVAHWPADHTPGVALVKGCEQAMQMRMPVMQNTPDGQFLVQPVLHRQDLYGVVALTFDGNVPEQFKEWLSWGLGWLLLRVSGRVDEAGARLQERLMTALDLMLSTMEEKKWQAACQTAVTEVAVRLGCDRVSIGFGNSKGVKFTALSHSADFSKRIDLIHVIEAAMNEATDQGEAILFSLNDAPEEDDSPSAIRITRDHQRLAREYGNPLIYSVPFFVSEESYGVFLFEWPSQEVDPVSMLLADTMPAIIGRVLLEKREQQLPLHQRLSRSFRDLRERLFGPRHTMFKLVTLLLSIATIFFYAAKGEYRISADARLEGAAIRVVVSPYDAFVASARIRAGQTVTSGQVLATLDDRDLQLESSRWASQQLQYHKQLQDAEAQHDLAQVQIARAQVQQSSAQLRLTKQKIERASLMAPFDGIVISGDLSQQLGGALEKGQVLFEVAPLDSYRVVLYVREEDMSFVQTGQQGLLMVAALPGMEFPFSITLITPVAQDFDGKNSFRVEASFDGGVERLRPGMEGIGKISIGERRLIWIWTHRSFDWLRLQLWHWFGI